MTSENNSVALDPWADPKFEQAVRDTAYFMWENDGHPEGREQEYWYRALSEAVRQREIDQHLGSPPSDGSADDR